MNRSSADPSICSASSVTPIGRRRPFGAPLWRLAIQNSQLPTTVQVLLLDVVGNTRLLSDEKLQVAEELIAHFEDGLQRGRDSDSLIKAFGDPQLAAQLIQRGKRRNRSMKNRWIQAMGWASVAGLGVMMVLFITFYRGKPQPTVDYVAVVNRPSLETADSDKGWNIYRDLWIKFDFARPEAFSEIQVPQSTGEPRLVRPGDGEAWRIAVEKLANCEDLLEGFRIGSRCPTFGLPLHGVAIHKYSSADLRALEPAGYLNRVAGGQSKQPDPVAPIQPLGSLIAPQLFPVQKMAWLLIVDSRLAIQQSDSARVTRNVEAIFGLARQISEGKFVMGGLLGLAMQSQALDVVDEAVHARLAWSPEQLERLQAAVEAGRVEERFRFSTEQVTFLDMIQHSYTDDGQGDGRITWDGLAMMAPESYHPMYFDSDAQSPWSARLGWTMRMIWAPTELLKFATRKSLTDQASRWFARVDDFVMAPWNDEAAHQFSAELAALPESHRPLQRFIGSARSFRPDVLKRVADRESGLAALAVLRYRQQHGRWPARLADLVGSFLQELPRDPVNGQPLGYAIFDEGFFIYSVGSNAIDDRGLAAMRTSAGEITMVPLEGRSDPSLRPVPTRSYQLDVEQPGDWILWPRYDLEQDGSGK
jgi:hypothetical protein